MAAALFSLDAAVVMGPSLLVVTLPALRPSAVISMVAGIVAYLLGGVQLDTTALVAKGTEVLAPGLLLTAIVRAGGQTEVPTSASPVAVDAPPPARDNVGARCSGGPARVAGAAAPLLAIQAVRTAQPRASCCHPRWDWSRRSHSRFPGSVRLSLLGKAPFPETCA